MDRQEGLGAAGDPRLDQGRVHEAGLRINVDQHRRRAGHADGADGGDGRVGHGEHFVARPDAQRPQGDGNGVGAITHGHGLARHAEEVGEVLLELPHPRTEDQRAGVQHLADRLVDLVADLGQSLAVVEHGDRVTVHRVAPSLQAGGAWT